MTPRLIELQCPSCNGVMEYQSGVGHDTHPGDALPSYYYCPNRKCDQLDLDYYPPHEPLRTRWGRE